MEDKRIITSPGDCVTLEDYYEYKRYLAKKWYEEHREYKIAYQKEYYKRKKLEDAKKLVDDKK